MKVKDKLRKCFRLRKTKETWQDNVIHDSIVRHYWDNGRKLKWICGSDHTGWVSLIQNAWDHNVSNFIFFCILKYLHYIFTTGHPKSPNLKFHFGTHKVWDSGGDSGGFQIWDAQPIVMHQCVNFLILMVVLWLCPCRKYTLKYSGVMAIRLATYSQLV